MSEFKRALLFITCLCLALCSFNNASAQEENRLSAREKNKTPAPEKIGRPDFGDGVLEEVTDKMERLLELEWKGDSIGLKRSWDKKKKKKASGDEEDFTSPLPTHRLPLAPKMSPPNKYTVSKDHQLVSGLSLAVAGTFLFALKSIFIKLAFAQGVDAIHLLAIRFCITVLRRDSRLYHFQGTQSYIRPVSTQDLGLVVVAGLPGLLSRLDSGFRWPAVHYGSARTADLVYLPSDDFHLGLAISRRITGLANYFCSHFDLCRSVGNVRTGAGNQRQCQCQLGSWFGVRGGVKLLTLYLVGQVRDAANRKPMNGRQMGVLVLYRQLSNCNR